MAQTVRGSIWAHAKGILKTFSLSGSSFDAHLAKLQAEGELWPEADGVHRLRNYARWFDVYAGNHQDVFEEGKAAPAGAEEAVGWDSSTEGDYYAVNFSARATKLVASRLVGQTPQPVPVTETQEKTPEDEARAGMLQQILEWSRWPQLCDRVCQGHSYRGDAVLKAFYDAETDQVKLKSILPSLYWPLYDEDDSDKLRQASIVWEVPAEDPKDSAIYLREERHTPGQIENLLWRAVNAVGAEAVSGQVRREQVPLETLPSLADVEEKVATGIDVIPLVLIPNMPVDETLPYGISDYAQPSDLQKGVNRSVSRAWNIADKHEELALAMDESFVNSRREYNVRQNKILPLVQHEPPPQYIMYPADASQSLSQAQEMMRWFCLIIGISPESLGLEAEMGAESGFAIRLRQMLTTSTVEKKRTLLDEGFRHILSAASKLYVRHVVKKEFVAAPMEPQDIRIEWSDGLPEDQMSEVQKASVIKTSMLPVPDLELLRMMFPRLTEADLQAMLEQFGSQESERLEASLGAAQEEAGGSTEIGEGSLEETVAQQAGEEAPEETPEETTV